VRYPVLAAGTAALLAATVIAAAPARAAVGYDSSALRDAVTLDAVRAHQHQLQLVANANDGTRVSSSSGHVESAEYVYDTLAAAGYQPVRSRR
jgi:hypothetical protein